jgi:hypothetical protein
MVCSSFIISNVQGTTYDLHCITTLFLDKQFKIKFSRFFRSVKNTFMFSLFHVGVSTFNILPMDASRKSGKDKSRNVWPCKEQS